MINEPGKAIFAVLAIVVVSSGCIQGSSTNLNSDFDLDYQDVSLNSSGEEIFQNSISSIDDISRYDVQAINKIAMNLPVISFFTDMTSEGLVRLESSEFNSSGNFQINLGDNSSSTDFTTNVNTSEDSTVISRSTEEVENSTDFNKYSRKELGLSLESLQTLEAEDVETLGTTEIHGEENIVLDVEFKPSDLMDHTKRVLQTHALMQIPPDADQSLEEPNEFDEINAYLWTERNGPPSKIAYYGSAENDSLQIRSTIEFKELEG